MASPAQKRGGLWQPLTTTRFCATCHDKSKGSDPCETKQDCTLCNLQTSNQCGQLATPSYKLKKEKQDIKEKSDNSETSVAVVDTNSSLVDPALVSVVEVVDGQGFVKSPGKSVTKEKQKKVISPDGNTKFSASKPAKSSLDKPAKLSGDSRSVKSSVDFKIEALDQKWSERFNRLEALLLARSLEKPQQELTFQTAKITPKKTPPVGAVK